MRSSAGTRYGKGDLRKPWVGALEILSTHKIDLFPSDVRMPVMDGIALPKKINDLPGHRPHMIPLSASAISPCGAKRTLYRVQKLLEKPIESAVDLLNEAYRSLTELDELCDVWGGGSTDGQSKIGFKSLAVTLEEKKIAFGCCGSSDPETRIRLEHRQWVDFTLHFRADGIASSQAKARGVARCRNKHEAGIEIMYSAMMPAARGSFTGCGAGSAVPLYPRFNGTGASNRNSSQA